MKAVILAGGFGTRISEESAVRPKPMVEIGGMPMLWHIMKIYSHYDINDFIICCGYKGYVIKEFFANYLIHRSDVSFDLHKNEMTVHKNAVEPWRVTLVDTGEKTMTGGRLKRVAPYVDGETFCFTYGDGLSDINVSELVRFHRASGALATVTAVQPPGRFGAFHLDEEAMKVLNFAEKPRGDGDWINGGFFVLEPEVMDYVENDATVWEGTPLERLAQEGALVAYKHYGFWQPMDTLRDKVMLEDMWQKERAHWKVWR